MKDKLEKALGMISLPPDLDKEVEKGVDRAISERRRISVTKSRSVLKIAAAAFALVIAAAAGFGIYRLNRAPAIPDDAILQFMGYKTGTTEPVVVELSADGNIIGKVDADEVVLSDENGDPVEPDKVVMMMTYWLDENGDLQCTDIPFGAYLVSAGSVEGCGTYELKGFNSDDFGDRITFSPAQSYLNAAEDGTAYDAKEGELDISLEKLPDGSMKFVYTPSDGSEYPYSEITEYHFDSVMGFESAPEYLGGGSGLNPTEEGITVHGSVGGPELLGGSMPGGSGSQLRLDDKLRGEGCYWEFTPDDNILKIVGAESEVEGWVKISSIEAKLTDGSRLELHGNWIVRVET